MRVAFVSDTHVGHARYPRLNRHGVCQRTADVARTFERLIDQLIALKPDAICHGGDLLDVVQPAPWIVDHAFSQMRRLCEMLPGVPIFVSAGNHEKSRTNRGSFLAMLRHLGVHVAIDRPEWFAVGDLGVYAVPESRTHPPLVPKGDTRYKVLLLHGEIRGVIRGRPNGEGAIAPASLNAEQWDWIMLGHVHTARQVLPNAAYAGSMDRVSADAWGELREEAELGLPGKTFSVIDLDAKTCELHPIDTGRRFLDLEMDGASLAPPDLNAAIASALDAVEGGVDDAVVRLVVHDCERAARKEIDQAMVRRYRLRALNLLLDLRLPEAGIVIGGSPVARPMSKVDRVRSELAARAHWNGQTVAQLIEDLGITPADVDDENRADVILAGLNDGYRLKPGDEPVDTGVPTVPDYTAEYERIVATHRMPEQREETNAAA